MKIGLYFGSFNPIHHGHLIIANFILQNTDIDQLWFIVSPQNPLKQSAGLLNEYHRLYLIQIAIEGEKDLRASDIEFGLPKPSYTANTLAYLKEKYPDHVFVVIMGSDSFQNIKRWKNYLYILENYSIFIYKRPGFDIDKEHLSAKIMVLQAPLLQISATHIRENIKKGMSVRYLVPDVVKEEIERNAYYKK